MTDGNGGLGELRHSFFARETPQEKVLKPAPLLAFRHTLGHNQGR